jgi:transposase
MIHEDPGHLLFLDETSTPTTLTPLRARSPRGRRAPGRAPHRRWANVTLLATLTPAGIGERVVIDGAATRQVCDAFIVQRLAPRVRPGQLVIMDNLSVHKSATARAAIAAAGGQLGLLPAYSPDCNPIELAFAKIKQHLRRAAPRSYAEVLAAVQPAITAVTAADARGFFSHVGYLLDEPPGQPL